MADPSNPSNMMSYEELRKEYIREFDKAIEGLFLSCFHKTEQGVVKIKELQTPSIIDILMEMQSSGILSDALSNYVKYLIDKENSAIPISVKSAMEKPANNSCISLPDVVNQDTIRPFQAEFVNLKSSSKSTETISSILMLGGATE
jgi:hypothetical protein